jgi:hypothetical protein
MSRPDDDVRREARERPGRKAPPVGKDIPVPANAAVAADVLSGDPIPEPDDDEEDNRPTSRDPPSG